MNQLSGDSRNAYTQALSTQYDDGKGAAANVANSNRGQKDVIIRKNSSKTFRPTSSQRGKAGDSNGNENGSSQNQQKKKGSSSGAKAASNASNGASQGNNVNQPGHYRNKS